MLPLCLIVGNDEVDPAGLHRGIDGYGFKPYAVETFSSALGMVEQWQFDAVIVDGDGHADTLFHLLPELRDRAHAPIVVVWSDGRERRQIEALQVGATEVIVKPASPRLIAAKLHRLIEIGRDRGAGPVEAARAAVHLGPLRLDPRRAAASVGDAPLALTTGEFELLLALLGHAHQVLTRDQLMNAVHGRDAGPFDRAIDVQIGRLRRKLEADPAQPQLIKSVRGAGYLFAATVRAV